MDISFIIQLISSAIGGNVAGKLINNFNLGTVGNSIAGVVGGAVMLLTVGFVKKLLAK